ncbi:hypothetical protein SMD20_45895 [Nonomuraea sp. LP-02]|uniref:hypothetical protein n=1 Tax=Nonomuraea sp. LP-02 TaxID=3097960 RepID=UPI002E2F85C1|nr:hypothetical protein [Nonomuraea sp. LP-02]MED7931621.1 hypothetical protein [Nonomuraea sp. LP-02]
MRSKPFGLSPIAILALAALGVPRVIAHDLSLVGPVVNALLVFLPIAVWLVVVLWRRVPNPFVTLLAIGVAYGVLLGVTHQVLWSAAFGDDPPTLGGNLAGALSPGTEAVLLRTFAFGSSVLTGAGVGVAVGVVGWAGARLLAAARR